MWSTSLGPNDYRNTKDLDPKALLRGCLPPRSWLSAVQSELRGGRHPLKSAPTSNFLSFLSSLGPKLVLHISGCLKNQFEYLVISWLAGWVAGWLAGWLTDWLAGWLAGQLAGWRQLFNCLVDRDLMLAFDSNC